MQKIKIIASLIIVGLLVSGYFGWFLIQMITMPASGKTTTAQVVGYKISSNGARKVINPTGSGGSFKGRSPWVEFKDHNNQLISTYSHAPQLFYLFGYDIGDTIQVAYASSDPNTIIILNWKEVPGLLFMVLFGALSVFIGVQMMRKGATP